MADYDRKAGVCVHAAAARSLAETPELREKYGLDVSQYEAGKKDQRSLRPQTGGLMP